jgi:hypothetical protein
MKGKKKDDTSFSHWSEGMSQEPCKRAGSRGAGSGKQELGFGCQVCDAGGLPSETNKRTMGHSTEFMEEAGARDGSLGVIGLMVNPQNG